MLRRLLPNSSDRLIASLQKHCQNLLYPVCARSNSWRLSRSQLTALTAVLGSVLPKRAEQSFFVAEDLLQILVGRDRNLVIVAPKVLQLLRCEFYYTL